MKESMCIGPDFYGKNEAGRQRHEDSCEISHATADYRQNECACDPHALFPGCQKQERQEHSHKNLQYKYHVLQSNVPNQKIVYYSMMGMT